MAVILESKAVCKYFGGLKAVNNVDMKVEQGQIFGIIGPNGAGKTTFFNLCSGTYKVTSGQILFDGRDITNLPPRGSGQAGHRAYLPEHQAVQVPFGAGKREGGLPHPYQDQCAGRLAAHPPLPPGRGICHPAGRQGAGGSGPDRIQGLEKRATCPTACSARWRSPGRWPPTPRSCCWTNRPPA